MNIFTTRASIDCSKYFIAEYRIRCKTNLRDAAWNLAIGQSVGNPKVRSVWETEQLFQEHSCLILNDEKELLEKQEGTIFVAFPAANIDIHSDGVSQLMCHLMGGQMDIDTLEACRLIDVEFPESMQAAFKGPKYGIIGVREFTRTHNKPLLGGIVKPKVGISPKVLLELVKEMVEGGVNFIKEDEIMSSPLHCRIEERVPLVMEYLKDKNVIYSVCINSDPAHILDRVRKVYGLGGNSVHVNFWSGLGVYKSIRDLDLPIFLHFQKSGDKTITSTRNAYSIDWNFICKLAGMMGADFIHAGMWGGYYNGEEDLTQIISTLSHYGTVPSLSCGMHPGLVDDITKKFGPNYMASCGGSLHGHPSGTKSGTIAMRQAIDGNHGNEYNEAIEKWGKS